MRLFLPRTTLRDAASRTNRSATLRYGIVVAALVCSTVTAWFAGPVPAAAADRTEVKVIRLNPAGPNEVSFAPVKARMVRLVIHDSTSTEPCIDELEVYGPGSDKNLALAASGAKASASSCLPGHASHKIEHLNDGHYGNARSWIPAEKAAWAQIELAKVAEVDRVVFSRDRQGRYADRLPTMMDVEASLDGKQWRTVKRLKAIGPVTTEYHILLPNKAIEIDIPPSEARFVRIAIRRTSGGAACIDELEAYGEDEDVNLAAAARGAKASASSCIEGLPIHQIAHLNDGKLGNGHSWIPSDSSPWAQVELPEPTELRRVVFSRDRGGHYRDRMPIDFEIQVSPDGQDWMAVKIVNQRTGLRLDQKAPEEDLVDWGHRIASAMRPASQEQARELLDRIETEADIEKLLKLHRLDQLRPALAARLALEFNPAALRRAIADLKKTFPNEFVLPQAFETRLADYEARLPQLQQMLANGGPEEVRRVGEACETLFAFSREVLLANPLLDFDELLVLRRRTPDDADRGTYWTWGQKYGMTVNWSCDFRPKNPPVADWWDEALVALSPRDGQRPPRTIFKAPRTHMIQQPDLHFDAQRLLFTMPGSEEAFQVFEINVDGTGLRQITRDTGPDVDNGDPCYLPDGRIIFNSTRLFTGVPCEDGNSYVSNLCLTNAEGDNTRLLTFDQESAWHPSILNNGRVLYTRYEYANISHQFGRLLFHMNPDGTNQMEYYGSNSYWPNSIFYARAIPNHPTMVAGVVCGHHGPNKTGRLVLFDPARGRRETAGAVQTIPGWGKPVERVVEDHLYGGDWPKFVHPWPLSDKYFLVSARLHPGQVEYGIYLVDIFDNVVEIARIANHSLLEPIPLKPRPTPPKVHDRVRPGAKEATVYLANIYAGRGLEGVPKGAVKRLRLYTYNYVYRHSGRSGFGHLATPGVDGPWEPRYLLGTVPVEEDGSALFEVPANTPIAVQPLDDRGRALQLMRSWFTAMPGEVLSCVGCHEQQNTTPPPTYSAAALGRPAKIEPWRGQPRGFDFELEVQPVLDKFCAGCHNGSESSRPDFARKSEAEKLRINREYHAATESHISTMLTPAFIALHPYVRRPHAESNYGLQVPGDYMADTSPLVQMLRKGHHGVDLDEEAWDRLITWIDLGAPDMGSWKYSEWGVAENYYERRLEMLRRYAGRDDDVERLPKPPTEIAEFVAPKAQDPPPPPPQVEGWPFDPADARQRQQALGLPETIELDLGNDQKLALVLIPPGEFVMGSGEASADQRPACRVQIEQPFYMSRHEITNAQYRALVTPEHRSGHVGWRSIDWRGEGYDMNAPDLPVVRVSWHEALAFCQALSAATSRPVTLPSEAEWEWACRAGSSDDLWYGNVDADFGPLENLAGHEQRGFAFGGKRKWFLRDDRFDDGAMIAAPVGRYKPNPWGLFDMAGNVSEWTRTVYRPYPYDSADGRDAISSAGEKVVRGGSWHVPPKLASSGFRWKYAPWRRLFNVGFRVVVPVGP